MYEPMTICGYNVQDLVMFAEACRKARISENELRQFCLSYETIYRTIQKSFEEELQKSIAEIYSSRFNEDPDDGYDLAVPEDWEV